MASQCQRSILSCARCRRRKIKCDRQLPACGQCLAARCDCTGIAAKGKTAAAAAAAAGVGGPAGDGAVAVPRSIVQHLESEIARLETALLQQGQLEVVQAADIFLSLSGAAAAAEAEHRGDGNSQMSTMSTTSTASTVPRPSLSSASTVTAPSTTASTTPTATGMPAGPGPAAPPSDAAGLALRAAIVGGRCLQSVIAATLPYEQGTAADLLSRVRMGLTPSSAKVRDGRAETDTPVVVAPVAPVAPPAGPPALGRTSRRVQAALLRSMPWDIVQRLLRKYLHTIQPDNPFLVAAEVEAQFGRVAAVLQDTQEDDSLLPSHDFLVVYLVLALSVTLGSANDGHEARCAALSMSLFEEGLQHLYGLAVFPSDLAWLQTILLVLLYATVVPRAANVWVLSGVAMRSCLELGLHREGTTTSASYDDDDDDDPDSPANVRRRVFWSAYCMDRSICAALQRPLSTPDAAIDVRLPPERAFGGAGDAAPFLGSVAYHRLLSEMLHVHFLRAPLPAAAGGSWDRWLADMEARLHAWHAAQRHGGEAAAAAASLGVSAAAAAAASGPGPLPWTALQQNQHPDFSLARALLVLHRPSPRVPQPAAASLVRAFEAATASERIHQWHLRRGFFRRPWLSAHYTLEAATVVLFCLRHGYAAVAARYEPADVFDRAKLLTANLLGIAAHGWPQVAVYAGTYERLLGPLLERVFLGRSAAAPLDGARFGAAEDAELMRLLYPGPAHLDSLRLGQRPPPEAFEPFDFDFFMDDELWVDSWEVPEMSMVF